MRLRRAVLSTGGWVLTAAGVVVIIVVVGGDHRFSGVGRLLLVLAIGLCALVPAGLGIAYMVVRRRNRTTEAAAGRPSVSPRARAVQTSLASMLDRVNDSTDDAFGLRRVVLTDRLELTAAHLDEIDDQWEALSFIWFVRPSQSADFPRSEQFERLPVWAQDAVVLLDLRRDIQLRGIASALSAEPGFYHHALERIREAVMRTRSTELVDALLDAQRQEEKNSHLLELLDDPRIWSGLFETHR